MTLSERTRLAMADMQETEATADLRAVLADWGARCDAMTAFAKLRLDPFEMPLLARVSPFGRIRPDDGTGFRLTTDCDAGPAGED